MKKSIKITLCILLVILLVIGFVAYQNRNTIEAFIDSKKYTQEELDERLTEKKDKLNTFLNESEGIVVREPTEEEAKAIAEGLLDEKQVVEMLTQTNTQEDQEPSTNNGQDGGNKSNANTPEKDPAEDESGKVVSESIAKLYMQKSKYLGMLDAIEAEAYSEYKAMSAEDKKNAKKILISKYMSRIAAWETECDGIVYGIIDEIKTALEKEGKDLAIVSELKQTYLNEKRAKKAYFINKYKN